jgi:hypothetical protein
MADPGGHFGVGESVGPRPVSPDELLADSIFRRLLAEGERAEPPWPPVHFPGGCFPEQCYSEAFRWMCRQDQRRQAATHHAGRT